MASVLEKSVASGVARVVEGGAKSGAEVMGGVDAASKALADTVDESGTQINRQAGRDIAQFSQKARDAVKNLVQVSPEATFAIGSASTLSAIGAGIGMITGGVDSAIVGAELGAASGAGGATVIAGFRDGSVKLDNGLRARDLAKDGTSVALGVTSIGATISHATGDHASMMNWLQMGPAVAGAWNGVVGFIHLAKEYCTNWAK